MFASTLNCFIDRYCQKCYEHNKTKRRVELRAHYSQEPTHGLTRTILKKQNQCKTVTDVLGCLSNSELRVCDE